MYNSSTRTLLIPTSRGGHRSPPTGAASHATTSTERVNGWAMGRSTMTIAILLVPFLALLSTMVQLLHSSVATTTQDQFFLPDYISNSAFDTELYHSFLQAPYRNFPCMPRKIHISQGSNVVQHSDSSSSRSSRSTGNDTPTVSMILSFTLDRQQCAHVEPKVVYGKGPFHHDESNPDAIERVHFSYTSPKEGVEPYDSDWIYHVTLDGLEAGLEHYWYKILVDSYQYKYHDTSSSSLSSSSSYYSSAAALTSPLRSWFSLRGRMSRVGESPAYSFRTPPLLNTPTHIALVGDIGQTENSTKTMNHILTARNAPIPHPVSAVIIAGDLSYADADPLRWESWLDVMEPLLRTTPMQTSTGNHEIECDNITNAIFVPYENYFRNPNRLGPADMVPIDEDYRKTLLSCAGPSEFLGHYNYGNAFYSYIHGMIQIVVLNSYTDTTVGSIQYKWLERELETIDRTVTPWLLVVFHCPLHTTFIGHEGGINQVMMLESMEPLLVRYHVNLVVSGHDHAFLRTHPMVGGKLDLSGKGPVYLTLGAGGNREGHTEGYINDVPESWVAKRDNYEYGYGNLFVANATHAHFTWVRDGTTTQGVQDDVWLTNQLLVEPTSATTKS